MITEAVVKNAGKFSPECIPDSWFGIVPAAALVAIPVLDLRRFAPLICSVGEIQLTANALVALSASYDKGRVLENTAAMLSLLQGRWRLPAKENLSYNLAGVTAAPVAAYTTHFNVWVQNPSIADKIVWKMRMDDWEKAIAEKHNLYNTIEKGLLPHSIAQQILGEYIVVGEESHSRSITIAVAATPYTIENLYPRPDEIIVLTRIAAAPGTAAQDVRIIIDRDQNGQYADVRCFPLSLIQGGEINCFIPATSEIRLTTTSTVAPGAHLFSFTFQRIRLTNILRCRFGLVTKDEVPGDTWDKVLAGIF